MLNWKVSAGLAAIVLHLATAGGPTLAGATKADPPSSTYHYAIVYPLFGRIGTFTNQVHADGERVAVESHLRIAIKMLFVTIHHVEADRTELWRGDRLARFNGTTDDNGQVARVEGHADGGKFLIDGPSGEITAPADVFPAILGPFASLTPRR